MISCYVSSIEILSRHCSTNIFLKETHFSFTTLTKSINTLNIRIKSLDVNSHACALFHYWVKCDPPRRDLVIYLTHYIITGLEVTYFVREYNDFGLWAYI